MGVNVRSLYADNVRILLWGSVIWCTLKKRYGGGVWKRRRSSRARVKPTNRITLEINYFLYLLLVFGLRSIFVMATNL